ncbi:MAG: PopZ family protein [Beijerinckiaceae bacterium]
MSAASPKSSEPSMEEILASIRRIIADDQPVPANADGAKPESKADMKPAAVALAAAKPPAPAIVAKPAMPVAVDDVLDLDDEPQPPSIPVMAVPALEEDIMFIERDEPDNEPGPALTAPLVPQPVAPPIAQAPLAVASPPPDALLSAQANEAVSNAFNNLAGSILAGSQRTLDDIVKDMMRPMLKVWLDDNLPSIVERLVRAEIERVARGGR